jgi:TolB-like protein
VLPFENLSPDPDNAFFTDGLHQEILTTLNRSPDLAVIPRTTMMLYRAAPKSVGDVAAELGATYVLEGSVRREGDAVRLTVHLVDTRDDRQLWSEDYDRTLASALTLQTEVAQQVAEQLSARLGIGQQRIAAANPAANDLYLKARLARQNLNGSLPIESWLAVETLLDQAIESDPNFARAYVARSKLHRDMGSSGYGSREERLALARGDLGLPNDSRRTIPRRSGRRRCSRPGAIRHARSRCSRRPSEPGSAIRSFSSRKLTCCTRWAARAREWSSSGN